jgi:hypothetical protein
MGVGTGGAIALAATIYPTPIRPTTGAGWGMAMGRFGQIIDPSSPEYCSAPVGWPVQL